MGPGARSGDVSPSPRNTALALYELVSTADQPQAQMAGYISAWRSLRALLGVPEGKLLDKHRLFCASAIQPAELEVNGLADFGVKIEQMRRGGNATGQADRAFACRGGARTFPASRTPLASCNRRKVGRMARLRGQVEDLALSPSCLGESLRWMNVFGIGTLGVNANGFQSTVLGPKKGHSLSRRG